ncbi:thiolase-like protein [Xylaria sp. FL0064]|nr:thiolase-like protein [Xylaria sp. FL0064]
MYPPIGLRHSSSTTYVLEGYNHYDWPQSRLHDSHIDETTPPCIHPMPYCQDDKPGTSFGGLTPYSQRLLVILFNCRVYPNWILCKRLPYRDICIHRRKESIIEYLPCDCLKCLYLLCSHHPYFSKMDETGTPRLTSIAIVGLALEFPQGADSEDRFWRLISEGRSTYTKFPPQRLGIDAYYHPDPTRPGNIPVQGGHFIDGDLGGFDAPFFNISSAEAACMDAQHRHMLETAYHALEDAGIPIDKCSGSDTAVFTGCFTNDYAELLQADLEAEQRHAALGVSPAMLANRVSWFFNLTGVSLNLDTACSSSLVALHLACQDLKAGNCSMALVGGANLVFHPNFMKLFSNGNFLGKDGRSWSFDQRANGYGRGEGHAVLVLKRVADAIRDGHTIRAVIRNTASNQDGRTPGITVPSADAQSKLIRRVFQRGNLDMTPARFFEAHGTGTPVGDPIEANAINRAFKDHRSAQDPLYIGAVKANIGHLEGASGLAGVIKTVLVLEKGIIPPIADLVHLNNKIDADRLHLVVCVSSIDTDLECYEHY